MIVFAVAGLIAVTVILLWFALLGFAGIYWNPNASRIQPIMGAALMAAAFWLIYIMWRDYSPFTIGVIQ